MFGMIPNINPPHGFDFGAITARCFNRTGSALAHGALCRLDLTKAQGETTSINTGSTASIFANVTPMATDKNLFAYVVAQPGAGKTIADNAEGIFAIAGIVDLIIPNSTAVGVSVGPTTSGVAAIAWTTSGVACGIVLEANSTGAAAAKKVLFNGLGFRPQ